MITARPQPGVAIGAALWIGAALVYVLLEAVAAAAVVPAYSYARNFISDLGVPAISPRAGLMNSAFYLQGILFLSGAVLISRSALPGKARLFVGLAAVNAVGNILVATFTSGTGALHTVGAVLAIGGGNAAILAGSSALHGAIGPRWYRAVSVALAGVGFLSLTVFWVRSRAICCRSVSPNGPACIQSSSGRRSPRCA